MRLLRRTDRRRRAAGRPLAAITAVALLVAACGGDDDTTSPSPAPATNAPGGTGDTPTTSPDTEAPDSTDAPSPTAATTPPEQPAPVASDEVLVIGTLNSPRDLNPATGRSGFDYEGLNIVYDTLVALEPATLVPQPGLAASFEFRGDNSEEFVMQIREGVTFQDGTPLDAEAVRASLQYYKDAGVRTDLDPVVDIVVEDPMTVVLQLDQPYAILPSLLADRAGMIISPAAIAADPEAIADNPVGTGPFQLTSWTKDVEFEFAANQNYWKGAPPIGGLQIRLFEEEGSMVSALTTGQLDYAYPVGSRQLPVLDAAGMKAGWTDTLQFRFLRLNQMTPPLDNKLVRQAINIGIDREAIALALLGDSNPTVPAHLPFPPGYWAYGDGTYEYPYDPEQAKALLAEAGFPDGVTVDVCPSSSTPDALTEIQILEEQLRASNITLNVVQVPGTGCLDQFYEGEWPLMLTGHTGRADPWFTYSEAWASWGANNMNNGEPIHPRIDEALLEIAGSSDIADQTALYEEIHELWLEEAPMVGLYYRPRITAMAANVDGELIDLQGKIYLANLYFTS